MGSFRACCHKSMTALTAVFMAMSTIMYTACLAVLVSRQRKQDHFALFHIFSASLCVLSLLCYASLHCISLKRWYLLHIITFILLLTLAFLGHSVGLVVLIISDCHELGLLNESDVFGVFNNPTDMSILRNDTTTFVDVDDNDTGILGRAGLPVHSCLLHSVVLMVAAVTAVLQVIALFDTQKVLVEKTRKKTYKSGVCSVTVVQQM